jgi:type II secretion system (T2SS) protein G
MIKKLIMLAFVALAIGMAVPSSRARIQDDLFTPIKNNVNARLVPNRLEAMADQLDVRLGRGERFPGNWEAWLRRDYAGVEEDPWGNFYYLQQGRRDYTVGSMAADGVQGTDDDITVTRRLPGS